MPASRRVVNRVLGLLERQGPPPPDVDVNVLRLWIRTSADPIGGRNQILPDLHKIVGLARGRAFVVANSVRRVAPGRIRPGEYTLLQRRHAAGSGLPAYGVPAAGGLTVLGWAYIDTGRWDEALDAAAEAGGLAEANQMEHRRRVR